MHVHVPAGSAWCYSAEEVLAVPVDSQLLSDPSDQELQ